MSIYDTPIYSKVWIYGGKAGEKVMDFLKKVLSGITGITLKAATKEAPNAMGCYKIFQYGALKYVGKAEDGIRKRFVQYYNGTTADYSSGRKIYANRDSLTVTWQLCATREQCRSLEKKWIEQYNPPWNVQGGWKNY